MVYYVKTSSKNPVLSLLRMQESQEPLQKGIPAYTRRTISVEYTISTV